MKDGRNEREKKLSQVLKDDSAECVFIGCFLHAVYNCQVKE